MRIRSLIAGAVTGLTLSIAAFALPVHNVPPGLGRADYVGRVDRAKELNLTVFLKMHDQAAFDRELKELYDPASPNFQKWFSDEDFARYAPTPGEFDLVRSELVRHGFTVVRADPMRFWIRIHGTAATIEKAFQTELHNYNYRGRVFQTHTRDVALAGPANVLIETVAGINRHELRPMYKQVLNPATGKPIVKVPLKTAQNLTTFKTSFTATPLSAKATKSTTDYFGATASYTGYMYAAGGKPGGFTPAQLQAHYGFPFSQTVAPVKTYDGAGQTIALVEGYGYPNALADANAAATLWGLPALVKGTNYKEIAPYGAPPLASAGYLTGWSGEIALDIQSAHALAPKATIYVIDSAGQDDEDQIASLQYVACPTTTSGAACPKPLAYVVSNSWENELELISGTLQELAFSNVLKYGAARGISYNFSTGDQGDNGLGQPQYAQLIPSNSPYATAVGGTTILNQPGTSPVKYSVLSWGNDLLFLYEYFPAEQAGELILPPQGEFAGGAGGGQSFIWAMPSWQKVLSPTTTVGRRTPDVSALADPYTGFPIVTSDVNKTQSGEVYGGTSLACPLFSAMWAIANQYKGVLPTNTIAPLGQAAPYMYAHGTYTKPPFVDAAPPSSTLAASDVKGSATDEYGTSYSFSTASSLFTQAEDLSGSGKLSLYGQTYFLSAIWDVKGSTIEEWLALSFGTDTSLLSAAGWDWSTGYGEPQGVSFVKHVTGQTVGR